MEERIFIQYLKNFSPFELLKFFPFLEEDLGKQSEKKTASYIVKQVQDGKEIEEAVLMNLLECPSPRAKERFKRFFALCTQIAENYLIKKEIKRSENKILHNVLLLRSLRQPKAENLFKHNLVKASKVAGKSAKLDVYSSVSSALLTHEAFFHPLFDNVSTARLDNIQHFTKQIDQLDRIHLLGKLKYTITEIVRGRLAQNATDIPFLSELLKESANYDANDFPLIATYRASLQTFMEFTEENYQEVKSKGQALMRSKQLLQDEKDLIFRLLVNHIAHALRIDKKYLEDGLDNYRLGISLDILSPQGFLPQEHFFNYIMLTCSAGRVKTADRFILDFQNKLHQSKRNQVVVIAQSFVLLAQNKYQAAFLSLLDKNFKDPHLRFMARSNRVIACYDWDKTADELPENEGIAVTVKNELASFKRVLLRLKSKLGSDNERLIANEHFLQMVYALESASKSIVSTSVKQKLFMRLKKYEMIACRKWLGEKIEGL